MPLQRLCAFVVLRLFFCVNLLIVFSEHELVGPVRLHGLFTRAVVVP